MNTEYFQNRVTDIAGKRQPVADATKQRFGHHSFSDQSINQEDSGPPVSDAMNSLHMRRATPAGKSAQIPFKYHCFCSHATVSSLPMNLSVFG
ncbi:hypothetical protein [Desulfosarcina ovata]|uniref:hypothetical protein n=1 Tax=Desulfosarcina ovata TaxID=83564 RepID=UPI0012D2E361|nr:hypothetical protein [Desulfosarcina ovata]